MPRKILRKDRRQQRPPNNNCTTQPLGWKQTQSRGQQNWWTPDAHENISKLGQYIVSNPDANSISQKQGSELSHVSPSYRRGYVRARGRSSSSDPKPNGTGLFHQSSRAFMLSSEIKEYLLRAVVEGKRRVDEWIVSEFEEAFSPERDIIIWEACSMDWQPESTVVIPQAVNIRYPWDTADNAGTER